MLLKGCECAEENSGNGKPGNYKMDEYRITCEGVLMQEKSKKTIQNTYINR